METSKAVSTGIWRMSQAFEEINEELFENGGELTPEIEEKLNAVELTKVDVADNLQSLIASNKVKDAAIAEEIKRLQALKKARANAVEGLKRYLKNYMIGTGVNKIEGTFCKVTLATGRESVECDEEALIARTDDLVEEIASRLPGYYDIEVKVNKTRLGEYLKTDGAIIPTIKEGQVDIPLAVLVKKPYIIIK